MIDWTWWVEWETDTGARCLVPGVTYETPPPQTPVSLYDEREVTNLSVEENLVIKNSNKLVS